MSSRRSFALQHSGSDVVGWTNIMNGPVRCVLDNSNESESSRRSRIICALGPASRDVPILMKMLEAGMNVARLNFSHGDHAYHLETLNNLREAVRLRNEAGVETYCAVLVDTQGPEIRTGRLRDGKPILLRAGNILEISQDTSIVGDESIISCSYAHLCESVKLGGKILIADGSLTCTVVEIKLDSILVRIENTITLEERKNMNLPGVHIRLPGITEKDEYDIKNFVLKHDIDIVSGSFIRTAENVKALRACLGEEGKRIRVHAKIESMEALSNVKEIIKHADGIHISRGDLGMEVDLSKLCLIQKAVIHLANIAGKPVVTSTQFLESMISRPRATRAECNDIANAVIDGSDCLMLSGETAKGQFPVEAIRTMSTIMLEAERAIDYDAHFRAIRSEVLQVSARVSIMEAIASSAVECAMDISAPMIVVFSASGYLAKYVAKYRPMARILVVTPNLITARQMSVSRGVFATYYEHEAPTHEQISRWAVERGWATCFDRIIRIGSTGDQCQNEIPTNYVDVCKIQCD